jgi:hypothetical protein
MNSNLKKFAFVPVLLLAITPSFASAHNMMKMACCPKQPTATEVKALIASAKTPEEHQKLACYFHAQARQEAAKARYHEEMAKMDESSSNAKHDMIGHCKQFAAEASKAAARDSQLAAEHQKMAEQTK